MKFLENYNLILKRVIKTCLIILFILFFATMMFGCSNSIKVDKKPLTPQQIQNGKELCEQSGKKYLQTNDGDKFKCKEIKKFTDDGKTKKQGLIVRLWNWLF